MPESRQAALMRPPLLWENRCTQPAAAVRPDARASMRLPIPRVPRLF